MLICCMLHTLHIAGSAARTHSQLQISELKQMENERGNNLKISCFSSHMSVYSNMKVCVCVHSADRAAIHVNLFTITSSTPNNSD